jgi:FkbM family methyltransferase
VYRVQAEPSYSLCLHPRGEHVSDTIRGAGQWADCVPFPGVMREAMWAGIANKSGQAMQPQTLHALAEAAAPFLAEVYVDVGANLGSCAFLMASLGHQVHAFEPVAANVQLLEATLAVNEFQGSMKVYHGLVSDVERDVVRVASRLDRGNMGAQFLIRLQARGQHAAAKAALQQGGSTHMSLPAWRLDEVISGHVSFLKLDCQGCELAAVAGAEGLFRRQGVDVVHLELSPFHLRMVTGDHDSPQKLLLKLLDLGMEATGASRRRPMRTAS